MRRGGKATLKGISVKTPPTKIQYLEGETFDFTGMVISANLSGTLVDVMSGYTCTPTVMGANDTTVTISYTVNGKTATTTQVMQKTPYKIVLAENTWEEIAAACSEGVASSLWSVGDQKTFDIDGKSYIAKIVDFNHYDLANTDAKYDTGYNGGTNKNALTFLVFTSMGTGQMHSTDSPSGWNVTKMRTETMPQKLALLPQDLQEALRTVTIKFALKYVAGATPGSSQDKLFIPGNWEIQADSDNGYTFESRFAYYAAGNALGLPGVIWTRDKADSDTWRIINSLTGNSSAYPSSSAYVICPVFCL